MSRNADRAAAARGRRKSRRLSLLVGLAAVAVVVTLLALEQIAVLYVLATLGVAALLAAVAVADLRGAKQSAEQSAPYDDAAAIGDGRTAPARQRPAVPRAVKSRGAR
jgi:hypothetical protein